MIQLRPATPDDAGMIAAYHHRCWVISFTDLLPPGAIDLLRVEAMLDRWHQRLAPDSGVVTVVADDDGDVIGHTTVGGNEVVNLFVHPDHQGRGIGRELLVVAERLIADDGHDEAELHTVVGNEPAIGLYRSAGWALTDRIVTSDDYGMVYDEHVLLKPLR